MSLENITKQVNSTLRRSILPVISALSALSLYGCQTTLPTPNQAHYAGSHFVHVRQNAANSQYSLSDIKVILERQTSINGVGAAIKMMGGQIATHDPRLGSLPNSSYGTAVVEPNTALVGDLEIHFTNQYAINPLATKGMSPEQIISAGGATPINSNISIYDPTTGTSTPLTINYARPIA